MKKLQTWDSVVVIAWKHKWAKSTITSINENWVVLKWVNLQKKAVKWEWFKEIEWPIQISNIAHRDSTASAPSRVWVRATKSWKERFYKKSGNKVA